MTKIDQGKTQNSNASSSPDPETVTISGYEVDPCYGPAQIQTTSEDDVSRTQDRIGTPGSYPFTRGIHPEMYRKRLLSLIHI